MCLHKSESDWIDSAQAAKPASATTAHSLIAQGRGRPAMHNFVYRFRYAPVLRISHVCVLLIFCHNVRYKSLYAALGNSRPYLPIKPRNKATMSAKDLYSFFKKKKSPSPTPTDESAEIEKLEEVIVEASRPTSSTVVLVPLLVLRLVPVAHRNCRRLAQGLVARWGNQGSLI